MRWLTTEYDRLYKQVREEGRQVVCWVNNQFNIRDIALVGFLQYLNIIRIYTVTTYHCDTDTYLGVVEEQRFIRMCEQKNVQWLDESEDRVKEAALRICAALQQKHRSTFKYLDVANEDKTAVLHHFGISAGASEINTP